MDNDTQFDPSAIRMAYFALLLSGRKYDNLELAVAQEMLKLDRLASERSLPSMIGYSVKLPRRLTRLNSRKPRSAIRLSSLQTTESARKSKSVPSAWTPATRMQ